MPKLPLVEAIAVAKVKAVEESIDMCHKWDMLAAAQASVYHPKQHHKQDADSANVSASINRSCRIHSGGSF
jgi:hypothetical protein